MKGALLILVILVAAVAALLYVVNSGIPLLEINKLVTRGGAYGFQIGMTKEESLRVIKSEHAATDSILVGIQIDESNNRTRAFESEIAAIETLAPSLASSDEWHISRPEGWINSIDLAFDNGRLSSIRRLKLLFERP